MIGRDKLMARVMMDGKVLAQMYRENETSL